MTWQGRIQTLLDEANRTNNFSHNIHVQKLYHQFRNAVANKDRKTAEKLVVRMGF